VRVSAAVRKIIANYTLSLAAMGLHRAILPDGFRQGAGPVNSSRHRATSGDTALRHARYSRGASLAVQAAIARVGILDRHGAEDLRPLAARPQLGNQGQRRHLQLDGTTPRYSHHVICEISDDYLRAPYSTLERHATLWQAAKKRPGFVLSVVVKPLPTLSNHLDAVNSTACRRTRCDCASGSSRQSLTRPRTLHFRARCSRCPTSRSALIKYCRAACEDRPRKCVVSSAVLPTRSFGNGRRMR